jgi:adenosine/AMP kinase
MDITTVKVPIPEGCNIILGQTHFIKTAEDLYEIIAGAVPGAKFGIAFTEASGPCLIRTEGNDEGLVRSCAETLQSIGAGHVFCILLRNAFPVNVLNQIKNCPAARARASSASLTASRRKASRPGRIGSSAGSSCGRSGTNCRKTPLAYFGKKG